MNKVKKIISVLLLICMVMTLLPMTVLAAPTADHPRDGDSLIMEFKGKGSDSGTTFVISAKAKDDGTLKTGKELMGVEKSSANSALYTFQFEAVSGSAGVYRIKIVYNNTTYYLDNSSDDPKLTTNKSDAQTWKVEEIDNSGKYGIRRNSDLKEYLCVDPDDYDKDEDKYEEYELDIEPKNKIWGSMAKHIPIEIGEPTDVTVTFEAYDGILTVSGTQYSGTNADYTQSVSKGSTASNPGTPVLSSHTFEGWFAQKADSTTFALEDTAFDFTNTKIYSNITLYAKYSASAVTINYAVGTDSTGKGSVSVASENLDPATGVATGSTAEAARGYEFEGWYSDAACTTKVASTAKYVPTKAASDNWVDGTTYYAKFVELDDVTINYAVGTGCEDMGSVSPTSESLNPEIGTADGSTATANRGYAFEGWYTDAACTAANKIAGAGATFAPTKAASDNWVDGTTFYAKFVEADHVTINYAVGTGYSAMGSVSPTSESLNPEIGTATGSTAEAARGYEFEGWYSDAACTTKVASTAKFAPTKAASDNWVDGTTFYAKFVELDDVTINYAVGTGCEDMGSVSPTSESLNPETGVATGSTATANRGYTFEGWYTDAACTAANKIAGAGATFAPTKAAGDNWKGGTTFYAKFVELDDVTINYAVGTGYSAMGSVSPASEDLNPETGVATGSTATANRGYTFEGWYSDAACTTKVASTAKFTPTKAASDNWVDGTTFYAKFVVNTYNVTVNYRWSGDSETAIADSVNSANVAHFTDYEVLIKNIPGYTFKEVSHALTDGKYEITGATTITVYYYKDVTLTGESASKAYTGDEISITGITSSESGFQFTEADISYVASGTDVGEYPGAFTVPQYRPDENDKYIIGDYIVTLVSGTLTIYQPAPETGSVILRKVDSADTNIGLAGAKFELHNADNGKLLATYTTNVNGQISLENLKPGNYYFVEIAPPTGYTLDSTHYNFTIYPNGHKFIQVKNDKTETPPELNGKDHYAYVIGYEDGTVRPLGNITRAEVATIFFRLLNDDVRDANLTTVNAYSDVSADNWFNTAVSTLSKMNIIKGYEDGTFRPNQNITRAEFAAIAARFDKDGIVAKAIFTDVAGHWAADEIGVAVGKGWVDGYPDNTFKPNQDINRAEAMSLINRVLNRIPEDLTDLLPDMVTWSDNVVGKWYYIAVQEATNSHTYVNKGDTTFEKWVEINPVKDWTIYE